jgi:hypothetical protein
MCNFFSGYIDKLGNIYDGNGFTDEHSVIAKINNLRDDEQAYYSQNLAKFEATPPEDTKLWGDFSQWKIIADERETPEWFDAEKIRAHVAVQVGAMFVRDSRNILLGGCYIFDGKGSNAKRVILGRIIGVINGANLARANLDGANLARANLAGANLAGAYLAGANLAGAYLAGWDIDASTGFCTKKK